MNALRIAHLAKRYGDVPVLDDVSLEVPSGALVAILGASGSGKSTLLRLVCGFERADGGSIRIGERLVCGPGVHEKPERRRVGYVSQDGALFPHLSVAENIVFGLPRGERRAGGRVDTLLAMVGLPASYAARPPQALSGGEQQRVALARALAPRPGLILLDEPFSALDAALRAETREVVAAALAAAGATAVLVTHDQSEALSLGHKVAVLRHERLVQVASPRELYARPADAALARFVGEAVLLPGVAAGGHVSCALGRLPLAAGMPEGAVEVMVRPEQIRLCRDGQGIGGRVRAVTYYGHDASVTVEVAGAHSLALCARVTGQSLPAVGEAVMLAVEGPVVAYAPAALAPS
jgi:iron(III) transport system ATP-binding protein